MTTRDMPERFHVAFSFAGEQRDLVRSVAEAVECRLGRGTVFLDEWFEYYIAGPQADRRLQDIYLKRSELVVLCVSREYGTKQWTLAEKEAIDAFLLQLRAAPEERERLRILPVQVGDGLIEGLPPTTYCPDIRKRSAEETADLLILSRLRLIRRDLLRPPNGGPRRRAYLARCSVEDGAPFDLLSPLKSLLGDLGWSFISASADPGALEPAALDEALKECSAFIQLLGRTPCEPAGIDRRELAAAIALRLRRFRHRCPDLELKGMDSAHRDFITTHDVIVSGFDDFKKHLEKELREPPLPSAPRSETLPPMVKVVVRSRNPDPLWDRVFQWIYDQESILPYQLEADERFDSHRQDRPCHGFLVVCDADAMSDLELSTRKDMDQCLEIQLKEKNAARRPPVGLVYWPPPPPTWSRLLRATPMDLHRIVGDAPVNLGDFFAAVRRAAQ